jgi:hypothetical protein
MCGFFQDQDIEELLDGRPRTVFVLLSLFQIIFDPQLIERTAVAWQLAPK